MAMGVGLIAGVLLANIPAQLPEQVLIPRLERGQELVYRGTFHEEAARTGLRFSRNYEFEGRIFVLDRDAKGYDVAILSLMRPKGEGIPLVTLELARLDLQGKLRPAPSLPIEGPPTTEVGMVTEIPNGRIAVGKSWDAAEESRPPIAWKVVSMENQRGTNCYKLVGSQQSEEWGRSKVERGAWKRTETAWIAPFNGYASAVERLIEIQDPSSPQPNSQSRLSYTLESKLLYPDQLSEDRRNEISTIALMTKQWKEFSSQAPKIGPRPFEQFSTKITQLTQSAQPTPYREALLTLQRKADSTRTGDNVPVTSLEPSFAPSELKIGHTAPEFLTTDLINGETVRLSRSRAKPTVILYFNGDAASAEPTLRFMQSLREKLGERANFLAVAMKGEASTIRAHKDRLRLSISLLDGVGVRKTQRIETTPLFVVLDPNGMVRTMSEGWGGESASLVQRELDRWINR